jgi:hypothetical protein
MTPSNKPPRSDDEEIDRVRAARHRISARHGHDPGRLVEHYMAREDPSSPASTGRLKPKGTR